MVFEAKVNWETEIPHIIEMGKNGATYQNIGDEYGVSRERVRQIIRRYVPNWQDIYGKGGRRQERLDTYKKKFGLKKETDPDLYTVQRLKFSAKKAHAKRVGWSWDLNFGDLYWPSHCPILGIELDYFAEGRQENSPSFDQIEAGKGYVTGNVQILSWRANRIKNDGTALEHRLIAEYLDSKSSA